MSPGLHSSTGTTIALSTDSASNIFIAWTGSLCCSYAPSDVYVQRVGLDGSIAWISGGVPIGAGAGFYSYEPPGLAPDGEGGAFVAWAKNEGGSPDIAAERVNATGAFAWPSHIAVCNAPNAQVEVGALSDGAGGAVFVWTDSRDGATPYDGNGRDIYAQRIASDGTSQWTNNGVLLTGRGSHRIPKLLADPTGIPLITWEDDGTSLFFAQRVGLSGTTEWAPGGVRLVGYTGSEMIPVAGAGGLIAFATVAKFGNQDAVAVSISGDGLPGYFKSMKPTINAVADAPSDEGGWCAITMAAPEADTPGFSPQVTGYNVWRRVDPTSIATTPLRSASWQELRHELAEGHPRSAFLEDSEALAAGLPPGTWESIGLHAASQAAGYQLLVPTTRDSTEEGVTLQAYVVTSHTSDPSVYAVSDAGSGYSVDNLAPPIPVPFTANYTPTSNALHWTTSRARDLREFRLHRGSAPDFIPDPANLLAANRDTGYVDISGAHYYKLAAVDVHGNLSRYALVSPSSPVATLASLVSSDAQHDRVRLVWYASESPGVAATLYRRTVDSDWTSVAQIAADGSGYLRYEDTEVAIGARYGYRLGIMESGEELFAGEVWVEVPALRLAMRGATPNPSISGRMWVEFTLRDGSPAKLDLVDVAGRVLNSRQVGTLGPGAHSLDLSEAVRLHPGVYFLRLTQGGSEVRARAAVIR